MDEWIKEYLVEMLELIKIEMTDEISDIVSEYTENISHGVSEGYYVSGNYVADCNLKEEREQDYKRKESAKQNELDALYRAVRRKGLYLNYSDGKVYESGMEYVGGTISASYEREI